MLYTYIVKSDEEAAGGEGKRLMDIKPNTVMWKNKRIRIRIRMLARHSV